MKILIHFLKIQQNENENENVIYTISINHVINETFANKCNLIVLYLVKTMNYKYNIINL